MFNGAMTQVGATDNPGAVLPNGDILIALSPVGPHNTFPSATYIYEFNPIKQTFTDVTPPGLTNENAVDLTMLVLPTGQVLLNNQLGQIQIYTPTGGPVEWWRPTISGVQANSNGTFTLTGTELNGISEGANAGDDWQMATNYPIVQLKDSSGNVFYARTFNWSSTGVTPGNMPRTVNFQLPTGLPAGNYSLSVIANGIASHPISFTSPGGATLSGQVFAAASLNEAQHPGQRGAPFQTSFELAVAPLLSREERGAALTTVESALTNPIASNSDWPTGQGHHGLHGATRRLAADRSGDSFSILDGAFSGLAEEEQN
jgi:hypothetical protein